MKAGPYRRYTAEFREAAVRQVLDGGRSVPQVARSLEMSEKTLANWVGNASCRIVASIKRVPVHFLTKTTTMTEPPVARYGSVAQILHWVTALLVLIAFVYGLGGSEERVYAAARDFDRQLHETLGLSVFVLLLVRVLWRAIDRRPEPAQVARWMGIAAKLVQVALYLLMLAVPLTAITGAWLEGHPLTLLAGVKIQPVLTLSHDRGARIAEIHTWLGDAILWVAGLHALAAIYHHAVLRDGVLVSMLPRWLPVQQRNRR